MQINTKQSVAIALVLLGLLVGRDALAFYNPQTGRWLNRDPINEIGSKILIRKKKLFGRVEEVNLHAFAVNNALGFCDPLGKGAALEAAWTLGWELIEWASTLENGKDGWGYEPLYDRLTDVFANGVGAGLSEKCAGKCQECESAEELVKKAYKAARCCDHACAQLQSTFLAYAHAMQILTGEEWEE